MASLAQARAAGGVGSILVLLALIPSVGIILGIIGWILVLVAVKALADEYSHEMERSIFNNMIIGAVLWIIGGIVAGIVVLAAFFRFAGLGFNPTLSQSATPPPDISTLIGSIILGLVVIWIFSTVASIFIKRSYDEVSDRTFIGTFRTTGLLFLIGAITTIILVGFLIILVAIILQIVAFFTLPEQATHGTAPAKPRPPSLPPHTD